MVTKTVSKKFTIPVEEVEELFKIQSDRDLSPDWFQNVIHSSRGNKSKGGKQSVRKKQFMNKVDLIPFDAYESMEDYEERRKTVLEKTRGISPRELYNAIDETVAPLCGCENYLQWLRMYVYPMLDGRMSDEEIGQAIVSRMIDLGWDPLHMWGFSWPDVPKRDLKDVLSFTKRRFANMNHKEFRVEMMDLFQSSPDRLNLVFQSCVARSVPINNSSDLWEKRKDAMAEKVLYMVQYDAEVYQYYAEKAFKVMEHKTAMKALKNNDPMNFHERVSLEQKLNSKPTHHEREFENPGHNQLRKSIMSKKTSYDAEDAREDIFERFLKNNPYSNSEKRKKKEGSNKHLKSARNKQFGAENMNKRRHTTMGELENLMRFKAPPTFTPVDLENATMDEIVKVTYQMINNDGQILVAAAIRQFDKKAETDYQDDEQEEMLRDRHEFIAEFVERMINSRDPKYVTDGDGEYGCFDKELDKDDHHAAIDMLAATLMNCDDNDLLKYLMEQTSDAGYQKVRKMIKNEGKSIQEIRRIIIADPENFFDIDQMDDEEDAPKHPYDSNFQNFIISLYSKIRSLDITGVRHFVEDFLNNDDAMTIYQMIMDKHPLKEIHQQIFMILINEYDLEDLRQEILEDPEEVTNTEIDMKMVEYLVKNDGMHPTTETPNEDVHPDINKLDPELSDRYPGLDNGEKFLLYSFKQHLMDADDKIFSNTLRTMLDREDYEELYKMSQQGFSKDDVIIGCLDTFVQYYDLYDMSTVLLTPDIPLRKIKRKMERPAVQDMEDILRQYDAPPKDRDAGDDLLQQILSRVQDNEEEEPPKRVQFHMTDDSLPTADIVMEEDDEDRDPQRDAVYAMIQQEMNMEDDPLTREKDEMFEFLMKKVGGFDPGDLSTQLDDMAPNAFHKFKQGILASVKSGKIKLRRSSDEMDESFSRYMDKINPLMGANISSREDEEDDETDEEAERRFRKFLYST